MTWCSINRLRLDVCVQDVPGFGAGPTAAAG
jgi:hypothetical protein